MECLEEIQHDCSRVELNPLQTGRSKLELPNNFMESIGLNLTKSFGLIVIMELMINYST